MAVASLPSPGFCVGTTVDLGASVGLRPLQVGCDGVEAVVLPPGALGVHEVRHLRSFRWQFAVIGLVEGQCETDLSHVVQTGRLVGHLLGPG